jgi:hypothetical protein
MKSQLDNRRYKQINNDNVEPLLSATAKTFEQKILYEEEKVRLDAYNKKKMLYASHFKIGNTCDQQQQY